MLLLGVLGFMGVVSLWTPLAFERIAARWFSAPNIYFLWPVPLLTALTALMAWRWLAAGRELPPFLAAIALFLLGYLGLVISTFPYLVPPTLTVWQTAAAPASQLFMLVGTRRAAADHPRLHRVRLLGVPRQGARRRGLPLAHAGVTGSDRTSSMRRRRCHRGGDVSAVDCGRISPQPMRMSGSRPCIERSKARGTSGTRSGKRSLISGGGAPAVSVVGHTTIAPLLLIASGGDPRRALGRRV